MTKSYCEIAKYTKNTKKIIDKSAKHTKKVAGYEIKFHKNKKVLKKNLIAVQ